MKSISNFWEDNKIQSPHEDMDFIEGLWNPDNIPRTSNWYTQVFEYLGKDGTTKLISNNISSSFSVYKNFIGKRRHLDVGSGTGLTPLLIHVNKNIPVDMVDVYQDEIATEVKKSFSAEFAFTIYKSGDRLPFDDNTFDSASLFYVLHHCEHREIALNLLKEIYRVLTPNSNLIVIDEPVESLEDRGRMDNLDVVINSFYAPVGFDRGSGFDLANFYTKQELENQFKEAGFEIVKCIKDLRWSWLLPKSLYILHKS